jgi:hypothetical protein
MDASSPASCSGSEKGLGKKAKRSRHSYTPEFEQLWAAFPEQGRVAKDTCQTKYTAIIRDGKATYAEIIEGLTAYAASQRVAEGVICNFTTWLNQQRWTQRLPPVGGQNGHTDQQSIRPSGRGYVAGAAERHSAIGAAANRVLSKDDSI